MGKAWRLPFDVTLLALSWLGDSLRILQVSLFLQYLIIIRIKSQSCRLYGMYTVSVPFLMLLLVWNDCT